MNLSRKDLLALRTIYSTALTNAMAQGREGAVDWAVVNLAMVEAKLARRK